MTQLAAAYNFFKYVKCKGTYEIITHLIYDLIRVNMYGSFTLLFFWGGGWECWPRIPAHMPTDDSVFSTWHGDIEFLHGMISNYVNVR